MADNVQAEANQPKKNLFHMSFINLLVVEELRWLDKDWDSFLISTDIPRDPKGDFPLYARKTTLHRAGERMKEAMGKGKEIEESSSQQPTPWKIGRPKLIKKPEETQAPSEPCAQSTVEKLLVRVVRLEPVEGSSRGISERQRRSDTESMEVQESSQQLKKAQLVIVELYQENRDLRKQLAKKTVEVTTSQSRAGNANWIKRQLREAQDEIIKLREE
jgi:hypothetical protein